ncbi:MAG: hypothetical protein JWP52_3282, partial [Rhizobacter sp.]|nr:hypothetical protein [Rhizobacter sp.]
RERQHDAQRATRLLLALFVLLLLGLIVAVNLALGAVWWLLFSWVFKLPSLFFTTNTALVLLFVLGGALVETRRLRAGGGDHVARWAGGHELSDPNDLRQKRLINVVDEMVVATGLPRPRLYLLPREDAINAFAAGWTSEDAVLAVTRGALERLTRDELQGLVAHEFGHLRHDDLRLNMVLLALVWGLSLVHGYGEQLAERDENGQRSGASAPIGLVFMVVGSLGWLAGRMLQAAVSRQREFLADATAVQVTRSRDGIGGTLRKIWRQSSGPDGAMRNPHARLIAAMLLSAPTGWLASHPPLEERVRRIYGRALGPLAADLSNEEASDRQAAERRAMQAGFPVGTPAGMAAGVQVGMQTGAVAASMAPGEAQNTAHADERLMGHGGSVNDADQARSVGHGVATSASPLSNVERHSALADASGEDLHSNATPKATSHAVPTRPAGLDMASAAFASRDAGEDAEAIGRLDRLNGPGELRAAVLALLMPQGGAKAAMLWARISAGVPNASTVKADVAALNAASRVRWLDTLLARVAKRGDADRGALLAAAQALLHAEGTVPGPRMLQWLRVREWLAGGPADGMAAQATDPLAVRQASDVLAAHFMAMLRDGQQTSDGSVVAGNVPLTDARPTDSAVACEAPSSALMARFNPQPQPQPQPQSYASLLSSDRPVMGAPVPSTQASPMAPDLQAQAGLVQPDLQARADPKPPDLQTLSRAIAVLRASPWMQRPVLLRESAEASMAMASRGTASEAGLADLGDALSTAALLLDVPQPSGVADLHGASGLPSRGPQR